MKFFHLVFCLLIVFVSADYASAQNETASDIETLAPPTKKASQSRDRLIMELNYNDWLGKPDSIDTKWFNRGINVYFMYDFKLGKQNIVSFAPGLGFSSHNIYHNTIIGEVTDSLQGTIGHTSMYAIGDSIDYKNNKLNTNYVEVPLELRFKTKPNQYGKSFKVAVGARFGYLFNAHTKYKGEDLSNNGQTVKYKEFLLPNINKLRFGPSLRIGYGNFSIVSYYSLTGVFKSDVAPKLNAFSIGLSFNSF